ncbi:putative MYH7B protein, partial [Trypanosoma conorhini]
SGSDAAELRAQLEEAVRQRAEVQRELERTGEELHVLREQSGSDAAELRAQLEEAERQRAEVHQSFEDIQMRLFEAEKERKAAVEEKESGIRAIEEKLLLWKDKVLTTKARDDARIGSLEGSLTAARDDASKLVKCLLDLLSVAGEAAVVDVSESGECEADVASLLSRAESLHVRLKKSLMLLDVRYASVPLVEVVASLFKELSETRREFDQASAELLCCRRDFEEVTTRLSEVEGRVESSVSPAVVTELEARNSQLEEKCELLRREMKRQREAFQREKAQQSISASSAVQEGGATLRAMAGGVFEKDMLSLANQQSQRDNEIRRLRVQLQALEKMNAELQRQCEHNNAVVAQYTQDIEVLKAKERVQQSVEYVRNVILQFLCCSSEEIRQQMIPAIATVLEFSPKEKLEVQRANPACPRFH